MELLALSVGIGLVVGVLTSELFGLAAAGLVVPGYVALYLTKPKYLAATLLVAFVTFGLVKLVSTMLIVHGRRRTALTILGGYLLGMLAGEWQGLFAEDYQSIGLVVPGLLAMWMDRQGVRETLSALVVVSVVVRLLLILGGVELLP